MNNKIRITIVIVYFLITCQTFADTITLKDGSRIEGRIINATTEYVVIDTKDSKTLQISHQQIQSILFSWVDRVYLTSGQKITCKIINRIQPLLHIVTETGFQEISLSDVKMFYYYTSENLTVPQLSVTGLDFKNERAFKPKEIGGELYFGISIGHYRPPLNEWKENFMPAAWNFNGGFKTGYYLTNSLSFGVGIDYNQFEYTHFDDLECKYKTVYIYGGLEYALKVEKSPASYIFMGLDAGLLNFRGNVYLLSFRKIDFNENSIALMPYIGARTFINRRFSVGIEAAYLFEKRKPIPIPVEWINNLEIDFSGPIAFIKILYYL